MQAAIFAPIIQSPETGGLQTAATVAAMSALTGLVSNSLVYLTDTVREGLFKVELGDFASRITADTTGAVYNSVAGFATTAAALVRQFDGPVFVNWFGAIEGDNVANVGANNTAFAAAIAFIASSTNPYLECNFNSGIYYYNAALNWAIRRAKWWPIGEVRLRYTGATLAVNLDGLATVDGGGVIDYEGVRNLTWGPFIIEPDGVTNVNVQAMDVQSVHSSNIWPVIKGAGVTAGVGLRTGWCVCTNFNMYISGNGDGWYLNSKPLYGLITDDTTLAANYTPTSYCTFYSPIVEVCQIGYYAVWGNGNTFIGGTIEGHTSTGGQLSADCQYTRFIGTDFEANTANDLEILGNYNEMLDCESLTQWTLDGNAEGNAIRGGSFVNLSTGATADNNEVADCTYSGAISDGSGGKLRVSNVYNTTTNLWQNGIISDAAVALGASPISIVNTTVNDQTIIIQGGTVTAVNYQPRGGAGYALYAAQGLFTLRPGDSCSIVYSVVPTAIRQVQS